jgi:O-antigen ligase
MAPGTLAPVDVGQIPFSFDDAWETEPIRKISFYFCLAALFLRLGVVPELILYVTHVNTYLLYLVAPLAIVSTLLKGGVRRAFQSRASYYWLAFFVWMALASPFSSWPGGSVATVITYARVDVIFLVLVGGMALNWNEVRIIFRVIAAAAVVNLVSTRLFEKIDEGRVSLESSGSIGNSNDLAAHLILVLPFLLFFMTGRGRSIVVRIVVLGLLLYGVWIILGTASRGALIGLAVMFLCLLIHASLPQRLLLVVVAGVMALVALAVLPAMTRNRLSSIFGAKEKEADESTEARKYLFRTSVKYTIEHPVFGVGPAQFASFEGKTSRAQGFHGNWHESHCAYTEVSSECGVPALIFFTAGLGSAMLLVLRTYRRAKREGYLEIANGCFCYLLAMAGYLGALLFLAQAYSYQLPAMVGLAVTLSYAAMRTMRSSHTGQASIPLAPVPQGAIHR